MNKKDRTQLSSYLVMNDRVIQNGFQAIALSSKEMVSNYPISTGKRMDNNQDHEGDFRWKLSKEISDYPSFTSSQLLIDALYNMSLEELEMNMEEDGTFRTGAEWAGVWTRDISYSALLSLAMLQPEITKNSLMKKVKKGRIIQDTGTGGAYPISTDRVVWAIAAWEIYLVTGSREWLEETYPIIKNTLEDDLVNAFNPKTGMVKGESSFLDWREQTYPAWMQPTDIYESETLGTSAVHFKAHILLSEMAAELDQSAVSKKHKSIAKSIKNGINHYLWLKDNGYYAQYLYGRNHKMVSPRAEALGEALAVLFDIADEGQQKSIIANTPVTNFGIPCIFPQIPQIPPYHNDGIWPFVQAYWSIAAAKTKNEAALTQSLDALYRAAALFLTNKENFVAETGDYEGTCFNSDRQLWSVAGNLGIVFKVFFGMDFQNDRLVLKPFVPEKFKGHKKISGFPYRKAMLELELQGHGNKMASIEMDGQEVNEAVLPADLKGNHHIKIILVPEGSIQNRVNLVNNYYSPETPKVEKKNNMLVWEPQSNVNHYLILRNGKTIIQTYESYFIINEAGYGEYQVIAVDRMGSKSFAGEPIQVITRPFLNIDVSSLVRTPLTNYAGFSGRGYAAISAFENTQINFEINIPEPGLYAFNFIYSNGHGPINTDNRCAFRTLKQNGEFKGVFVFPQRGAGSWESWGKSNVVHVSLKKGDNQLSLSLEPHNMNMNGDINEAMLDRIELIKIR